MLISEGVGWTLRPEWSNNMTCNAFYISFGLFLPQAPKSQILYFFQSLEASNPHQVTPTKEKFFITTGTTGQELISV